MDVDDVAVVWQSNKRVVVVDDDGDDDDVVGVMAAVVEVVETYIVAVKGCSQTRSAY